MGFYEREVLPHLVDWTCGQPLFDRWRREVCEGLEGRVVEIGFGTGRNVPHYPDAVRRVMAVEPSDRSWALARRRLAASTVPVRRVGLDGHSLALEDASCDAALVTFTLCSVREPVAVLAELARVLVPGGRLHVLEHGLAPEAATARRQRLLDPIERRLAGGCSLVRDPRATVERAGFSFDRVEQGYAGGPRPWSFFTCGVARSPR